MKTLLAIIFIITLFFELSTSTANFKNPYEKTIGCKMQVPSKGLLPDFLYVKSFKNVIKTKEATIFRFGIIGINGLMQFAPNVYPTNGENIYQMSKLRPMKIYPKIFYTILRLFIYSYSRLLQQMLWNEKSYHEF